jgi:hypothetical protein
MSCANTAITWAGIECPAVASDDAPPRDDSSYFGQATDDGLVCATDPFDDFDDDDFDDEFDDDFEEEWDEELPGDADQFEDGDDADDESEGGMPAEPEFEDED